MGVGSSGFRRLQLSYRDDGIYVSRQQCVLTEKESRMRRFRVFGCACLAVSLVATTAPAQYGLYGAPTRCECQGTACRHECPRNRFIDRCVSACIGGTGYAAPTATPAAPTKPSLFSPSVAPAYYGACQSGHDSSGANAIPSALHQHQCATTILSLRLAPADRSATGGAAPRRSPTPATPPRRCARRTARFGRANTDTAANADAVAQRCAARQSDEQHAGRIPGAAAGCGVPRQAAMRARATSTSRPPAAA